MTSWQGNLSSYVFIIVQPEFSSHIIPGDWQLYFVGYLLSFEIFFVNKAFASHSNKPNIHQTWQGQSRAYWQLLEGKKPFFLILSSPWLRAKLLYHSRLEKTLGMLSVALRVICLGTLLLSLGLSEREGGRERCFWIFVAGAPIVNVQRDCVHSPGCRANSHNLEKAYFWGHVEN